MANRPTTPTDAAPQANDIVADSGSVSKPAVAAPYATPSFQCGCGMAFKNAKALGTHGRFCDYCTPEVKLWAKVDKEGPDGCWLWRGALNSDGYGHFLMDGRQVYGHRYIYELFRGPIPSGMRALHKCDRPSCVNPDHIFLGTQLDNMQDAMQKRRHAHGERSIHAKLTEAQVREKCGQTLNPSAIGPTSGETPSTRDAPYDYAQGDNETDAKYAERIVRRCDELERELADKTLAYEGAKGVADGTLGAMVAWQREVADMEEQLSEAQAEVLKRLDRIGALIAEVSKQAPPALATSIFSAAKAVPSASEATKLRELAERCRPAVAHDAKLRDREQYSDKYAHHYKPVLKAEAERAWKLLDDIDAIIGARPVKPHRSGGPTVPDGEPPLPVATDSRSDK